MTKILLVEDDENLGYLVQDSLESKGFLVELCTDGATGLKKFKDREFDLCVLDVMLPVMDGFTIAKEIRKLNAAIPLLFLTAKARQEDRIYGLTLGADDYITKPFSIEELYLRIKAILKRFQGKAAAATTTTEITDFGTSCLNYSNLQLTVNGNTLMVTQKEADLLLLLAQKRNSIVKREDILKSIWEDNGYFVARSMDVFISRVRKLLKPDNKLKITTIHGVGYKLEVQE